MLPVSPSALVLLSLGWSVSAQFGAKNGDWTAYGADPGHTRYSPLDQINADNFSKLEVAWRFKTDNLGPLPEFTYESTPVGRQGRAVLDRRLEARRVRAR